MQKAYAKNNMGKGRGVGSVIQSRIMAEAAGQKQARDLQFLRLADAKKRALSAHKYNMAGLAQRGRSMDLTDRKLKDQKDDFGTMIATGLLGTGMGYMEGERRRKQLAADRAETEAMRAETMDMRRRYYDRLGATGTYMRGGL
jgi:hypothetical protein